MKTTFVKTLIAAGIVSAPALLLAQTSTTPVPQAGTNAPAAQVEQPNTPSTSTDAANRDAANPSATTSTDAAAGTNQPSSSSSAASSTSATAGTSAGADISASAREQFTKLDANSDGSLSQEEFANYSEPNTTPARDASSSTTAGRNGTGPGTPGSTAGSTGGLTGANNDAERSDIQAPSAEERFRQLDTNNDGKLSAEEFNRASPVNPDVTRDASSSTGVGRNATGPGTPGSTAGSTGASTGTAIDADADDKDEDKRPE